MPFKGLKSDGTLYANFCPLIYNLQAKFVPKPPQFSLQIHSFGPSFIVENSCPQTPLLMRGHQNYTPICYNLVPTFLLAIQIKPFFQTNPILHHWYTCAGNCASKKLRSSCENFEPALQIFYHGSRL